MSEPAPAPAPTLRISLGRDTADRFAGLPGSDPQKLAAIGDAVRATLDACPRATRINTPLIDMYAVPAFLSAEECRLLVALIDSDVRPSTALKSGQSATHRTSETCRFSGDDTLPRTIEVRIADLLGLDDSNSESIQGQRYSQGQKFGIHNDYFAAGQPYSQAVAEEGGQRTWTAMAYCNQPERGGHTDFPNVPISIPPRAGVLLIWNNLDRDGMPNRYSHHEGKPVEQGRKYVLTKWFRERYWQGSERSDALRR